MLRLTSTADFRQCILIFTSNISGPDVDGLAERFPDLGSLEFQLAARDLLGRRQVPPEVVGRIRTLLLYRPLAARELLVIFSDKIQACGRSFGLTVRRISPLLLADLAARAASTPFGVRIAEQLVEQSLAGEFLSYLRGGASANTVEVVAGDGTPMVLPVGRE